MTKTIAQLWNGDLEPVRYSGRKNDEITELEDLIHNNLNKLKEKLSRKTNETFEAYTDCIDEYITLVREQAFCDGYCLATKLTTEALNEIEKI